MYWSIAYDKKNPDPYGNRIIENLQEIADQKLQTIRWAGHKFQFEHIIFEDGLETEAILLPLKMFEDFIVWHTKECLQRWPDNNSKCTVLGRCLENSSLEALLSSNKQNQ